MIKAVIIQFFLFVSSYIIPKQKNLILFGAGDMHDFRGNPKYLYLYLNINNSKYKHYWSTASKKVLLELKNKNYPVIYRYSLKGFWRIMRAKYLVIEKSSKDVYYTNFIFGRFNFLQTWHGITIKKLGVHAIEEKKGLPGRSILAKRKVWNFMKKHRLLSMMKYKLILSTTTNQEKLLTEIFLNKRVITLGYPRNDLFFNPNLLYKDYNRKFNLNNYNKIFLYAPTFRDSNDSVKPFSNSFLEQLNNYFIKENFLLIIKKHPLQKNIVVPKNLKNIVDYSSQIDDLHDILYFTDVLISDYSSAVNDFILTEKPNIYYNYDLEEYEKKCRGFYYNYYDIFPGPFANTEEELFEVIKSIESLKTNKNYQSAYNRQKVFFHKYSDGKSCERFMDYIERNL